MAKYTFTEQCEEIEGLHLEDGTTKIFLNMTSKNGNPELVSLLQYMKKTNLANPEILVRDERILRLDSIVNEVKESEEWEVVSMSIYSVALERGETRGKDAKLIDIICKKLRKGKSLGVIADELEEDIEVIQPIYEVASAFAPEYDSRKVAELWLSEK